MHVHLPKPLHGWREFLGEVGIIVLGVLIALAAEQAVEALHWRHEVDETRAAMKHELQRDMAAMRFAAERQPCATRRLSDLDRWLAAARAGRTPTLREPIGRLSGYAFQSGVWDVAKAGQAISHMPIREQLLYARAYMQVTNMQDLMVRERDAWLTLGQFNGATMLDHQDMMHLTQQISTLQILSRTYQANMDLTPEWAGPLDLQADPPLKVYSAAADQSFCRPLF